MTIMSYSRNGYLLRPGRLIQNGPMWSFWYIRTVGRYHLLLIESLTDSGCCTTEWREDVVMDADLIPGQKLSLSRWLYHAYSPVPVDA